MAAVLESTKECSVEAFDDCLEDPLKLPNESPYQVCRNKRVIKCTRRSFSFEEKLKIINLLNTRTKSDVCIEFTLDESTLNKWIKQHARIKEICTNNHGKKLKKQKTTAIKQLDDMLYDWFVDQRAIGAPISGPILKAQALALKNSLGIKNFKASNHWLDGWKKRKNVRLLKMHEDEFSADESALISFKSDFKDIIIENELTRAQVFNFDDSVLNFKTLPAYTFVSSEEQQASDFKRDKSRVTFAACSNADGSLKLPLLIVGRSEKPRVLKSRSGEELPVFYTHSKNSSMTAAIFQDWFETEFVPKVQVFLHHRGLPMKAILLVDNCKSQVMLNVGDIKTEFFPPNITSIAQPMDKGILETLKRRYKAQLVTSIVEAAKKGTSIPEHLKSITLDNVIDWISEAWNEMSLSIIYRSWRIIWPVETNDAETQTEPEPFYSMVENESDETIFDRLINSDEVFQSFRMLNEYAGIDKETFDLWMNNEDCGV